MVPYTLEGSYTLHQMVRMRWDAWKSLDAGRRAEVTAAALACLQEMEPQQTAIYSMLGHKADIMLVHFRPDMVQLNQIELRLAQLGLWDYFELTTSYVSVVELGLYDTTGKILNTLTEQGVKPGSEEWSKAANEELDRQRKAMAPRLEITMPAHRYICFYPMGRKRGEAINWYTVPFEERRKQMEEHGAIGRRYAGTVRQVISGSIGFDDWEWGVDLWSEDPVWFKKLIYEMRFDKVSAVYAEFGTFYVGMRLPLDKLTAWLDGSFS